MNDDALVCGVLLTLLFQILMSDNYFCILVAAETG